MANYAIVEQEKPSTSYSNGKWCIHGGKLFDSSQRVERALTLTQQSHSWVFTWAEGKYRHLEMRIRMFKWLNLGLTHMSINRIIFKNKPVVFTQATTQQ